MRRYTRSVAFNRAVGVVLLVVLTGLPAAATQCLALCAAAPDVAAQSQQAPPADHQHGSAHDHGAAPVPSAHEPADAGGRPALRGVPAGCETHGSAALEGPMALAAGRADAGILGAGKDQPVSWDVPAVIDCLSCPRAGPPVAGSSPLGPATPASILFALRI